MGQVYEVEHVELGRRAALKMLRPELAKDESMAARFFTEARAMSLVQHPGLVHVYEYGHLDDGSAYIVMEYLEGETLREFLSRYGGKVSTIMTAVLGRQMAAALLAAHDKGVVHRDLKPENIKIVEDDDSSIEGRVKILDFGIAKMLDAADAQRLQTRPGQILGTPTYLAPEQAGGPGTIGPHTDVYALGAMLFEMSAGQPPFSAEDGIQLIGKHLFSEPPRLGAVITNADPDLEALLIRMLAKQPQARPSMREVKAQLGMINRRGTGPENVNDSTLSAETFVMRRSQPTVTSAPPPSFLGRLISSLVQRFNAAAPAPAPSPESAADSQAETYVLRRAGASTARAILRLRLKQLSRAPLPQKVLVLIIGLLLVSLLLISVWGILRAISNWASPEERPTVQEPQGKDVGQQGQGATKSAVSGASAGSSNRQQPAASDESPGSTRTRRKDPSSGSRRTAGSSSGSKRPLPGDSKSQPDDASGDTPKIVD